VEYAIAQDAGIVDDPVDAPVGRHGLLHDAGRALVLRDAVRIGDGFSARGANLARDLIRDFLVLAFAGHRGAQIVDHDLRPVLRRQEREFAADASARTGDYDDLVFQHTFVRHAALS
jgi:hypothetical protein